MQRFNHRKVIEVKKLCIIFAHIAYTDWDKLVTCAEVAARVLKS